jgi:hypothetical protein
MNGVTGMRSSVIGGAVSDDENDVVSDVGDVCAGDDSDDDDERDGGGDVYASADDVSDDGQGDSDGGGGGMLRPLAERSLPPPPLHSEPALASLQAQTAAVDMYSDSSSDDDA